MISGHLYIPRQGDRDFFINYYNDFMKLSDLELENANISAKKKPDYLVFINKGFVCLHSTKRLTIKELQVQ